MHSILITVIVDIFARTILLGHFGVYFHAFRNSLIWFVAFFKDTFGLYNIQYTLESMLERGVVGALLRCKYLQDLLISECVIYV